jgi:hypothetical protein
MLGGKIKIFSAIKSRDVAGGSIPLSKWQSLRGVKLWRRKK